MRLTTDHCAYDERVRPARCLCRCWGSEWGGVETTPQRPKILKPPPNHPPQNKPPTATKRLPLSLAPISSRAYSIPVHVSSPSTFPETCQQIVRQPPTLAALRGTRPEWVPTCWAGPTRVLLQRAVDLLSSSPRSCTANVVLPEPYCSHRCYTCPQGRFKAALTFKPKLQQAVHDQSMHIATRCDSIPCSCPEKGPRQLSEHCSVSASSECDSQPSRLARCVASGCELPLPRTREDHLADQW